tara:strand:- start:4681 stop:5451 length:771 start_codon:yes stop_codon:yes gene_type:complete
MNGNLLELMQGYYKRAIGEGGSYEIIPFREPVSPSPETTKAVSTGVAHDEINKLIHKKKDIEPSLLDFIRESVSTAKGIEPEDTPYGQSIAQLVEEYGNPYISPEQDFSYESPAGGVKINFAFPEWRPDKRYKASMGKNFPEGFPVDTIRASKGDIDDLLAELAHSKQFQFSDMILPPGKNKPTITDSLLQELKRELKIRRAYRERNMFEDEVYNIPGTVEYEAHEEIEPLVRKRFETLLDSLSQPITVESLFPNQ